MDARDTHVGQPVGIDAVGPEDRRALVGYRRIGRTGRAGRSGEAILFIAPRERGMLRAIERATNLLPQTNSPSTFTYDRGVTAYA